MIINQITITAEASKAYQKYCVALTAQDLHEGDIDYLKSMAITEAVKGINELAGNVETKPEVKVTTTQPQGNRIPSYRTDSNYQATTQQQSTQTQQSNVVMIDGFAYKHCVNKQTGERFLALVNPDDLNRGAKKYVKE